MLETMKKQNPKISILMPSYNDEAFIAKSIHSVLNQNYQNWELIIVDDGSTDNTKEIILSFKDTRIHYIYQENSGQLNALLKASQKFQGDFVMLFHSDDLLAESQALSRLANELQDNPQIKGLYADFITINAEDRRSGIIKTAPKADKSIIQNLILQRGSNNLGDPFFLRKESFLKQVLPQYIKQNTVYFIDYQKACLLILKKTQPWYAYRVFEENYIHSEIGQFVTFNGRMRTLHFIFKSGLYFFPNPYKSYFIFRLLRKLKLDAFLCLKQSRNTNWPFIIDYLKIWQIAAKRKKLPEICQKQLKKALHSAYCRKQGLLQKPLQIQSLDKKIYQGKDARRFFQDYQAQKTGKLYTKILEDDFDHIVVENKEEAQKVEEALLFYSFYYQVVIKDA